MARRGSQAKGSCASCPRGRWLGRQDSNLRMPVPKTGVLPLDDAPPGSEHFEQGEHKDVLTVSQAPSGDCSPELSFTVGR